MTEQPATYNGLTLPELQLARRLLQQAKTTGTLAVQYPDGTRLQYRTMEEMDTALRDLNYGIAGLEPPVVNPLTQPVRSFRVRPWNGYR